MAEIKFYLYDIDENRTEAASLTSFELTRDIGAACDGLRMSFMSEQPLCEINRVEAYLKDKLIFSGYCDTQRETLDGSGFRVFVYARSSASLLLDNEAKPFTYKKPSAVSLFKLNAESFGFEFKMKDYCCESDYVVNKGCSCYGAVNNFISGITGRNIAVSPEGAMYLPSGENTLYIDENSIISEKRIINRGEVLSMIDFKTSGDIDYSHHITSRYFDEKGCRKSRKMNLSALPEWQRQYTLLNLLRASAEAYSRIELVLNGCVYPELYDKADYTGRAFGELNGYYVSSVCIVSDGGGERTAVTLSKSIDLKEITYVAK